MKIHHLSSTRWRISLDALCEKTLDMAKKTLNHKLGDAQILPTEADHTMLFIIDWSMRGARHATVR